MRCLLALALVSTSSCFLWASKGDAPADAGVTTRQNALDDAMSKASGWEGTDAEVASLVPPPEVHSGDTTATGGLLVNRIIATLDGDPITLIELENFRRKFDENPANPAAGTLGQRALLDELLLEKIFDKQIEEQGLTASDQQVEDYLANIRSRNQLTEEQLKEAVETRGLKYDAYVEQIRTDIERANLVNKEIRARVNVTPEEVERYYQSHLADYALAPRVHVRLISLPVAPGSTGVQREVYRDKIEEIHAEAAGGANFAKLAREHSQGPGAEDGGDLGIMGRGEMQGAFDEAAFSLAEGEVSDIIETETGFHILKVEEHLADSHTPLEDVRDDIREELYRQAMEERYDRWLTKDLRERHHIEILL